MLHAAEFARLAEITQVVSPDHGYVFHNRLTHSLKVGQIARRLAEKCLREQPREAAALEVNADSAEAAGLAHDLGHPPFGHIAEDELNRLVREARLSDGYEGNAQSFRIVSQLAASDARDHDNYEPVAGLNLTRSTLNGLLKYPWAHGRSGKPAKKWGYYNSEAEFFCWVRSGYRAKQRSAVAEIMDWADDVTFAIHDVIDFFRAGRIPVERCKGDRSRELDRLIDGMFRRNPDWADQRDTYKGALRAVIDEFPFEADERFEDSESHRARLHDFATGLIRYYLDAFRLSPEGTDGVVTIDDGARRQVEVLKQFTWEYVIEDPLLAVTQSGQRAAIRSTFHCLLEAARDGRYHLFPVSRQGSVREARDDREKIRQVADTIAGMTEVELTAFHRLASGV